MSQALVISGTIKYGYDGEGRRISQKQGSTLTNYLWDEGSAYGDVLLETNGTGALGASYMLAGGEVLAQTTSTGTNYLLHDKQGSTRAVSGTNGSIGESHVYDAYGSLKDVSGTPGTKYLYTGQQFDAPTGLYSLRARYYNTTLGQFLSRDTVNDGLNFYGYVHGNPINRYDPSGHTALTERQLTTIFLVGVAAYGVSVVGYLSLRALLEVEEALKNKHIDIDLPNFDDPSLYDPNQDKEPKKDPAPKPKCGENANCDPVDQNDPLEDFFRGTTYYDALRSESEGLLNSALTSRQSGREMDAGLYTSRNHELAKYFAYYNSDTLTGYPGQGGPAILTITIKFKKFLEIMVKYGVIDNRPVGGVPTSVRGAHVETLFPYASLAELQANSVISVEQLPLP